MCIFRFGRCAISFGIALVGLAIAPAQTIACSLALALGLDVSGSVDDQEYRLQLYGLAGALRDPAVQSAFLTQPQGPVRLMIYEWSARAYQRDILSWTRVADRNALETITHQLEAQQRQAAPFATSIGAAMEYAAMAFMRVPDCRRHTLDLSGDGPSNNWPSPERVRDIAGLRNVTINALVIGSPAPLGNGSQRSELSDLREYYTAQVISGPGAFVIPASGFESYRSAMVEKLLRELEGLQLSELHGDHGVPQ